MDSAEQQDETATSQQNQSVGGPAPSRSKKTKAPTLTERMNCQEVTLEMMRREFMRQFEELHKKLDNITHQSGTTTSRAPPPPPPPPPPPIRVAPENENVVQREVRAEGQVDTAVEQNATVDPPARENAPQTQEVEGRRQEGEQSDHMADSQGIQVESSAKGNTRKKQSVSKIEEDRKAMTDFYRLNPPAFEGGDGMAAEKWIAIMNKKFSFLNSSDSQKVRFATFRLEGDADMWWEAQSRAFASRGEIVTWEKFQKVFLEKFFPTTVRAEKAREFANLKQGQMTVGEYEQKFSALVRFAPDILANEEARKRRFEEGLSDGIRAKVLSARCQTFGAAMEKALEAEKELEETIRVLEKRQPPTSGEGPPFKKQAVQRPSQFSKTGTSQNRYQRPSKQQVKKCERCQRYHSGECNYQKEGCFKCGQRDHQGRDCTIGFVCYSCKQPGHVSKDCPGRGGGQGQQPQQNQQARPTGRPTGQRQQEG